MQFLGREMSGNGNWHSGQGLQIAGLGEDGEGVVRGGLQVADCDGVCFRGVL